jgi:hypothetical protein
MEDTPEIEELKEKAPDAVADIPEDPLILDDTAKLPLIVLVIEELPEIDPAIAYDPLVIALTAEVVDIFPLREKLAVPIAFSVVIVAIVPKLAIVLYDVVDIAELPVSEPLIANDPLIVEVTDELLESVPLNAKAPLTVTFKLDVAEIDPTSLLVIVTAEFVMLEEAPNDPVMIVVTLALATMNDPDPYVICPYVCVPYRGSFEISADILAVIATLEACSTVPDPINNQSLGCPAGENVFVNTYLTYLAFPVPYTSNPQVLTKVLVDPNDVKLILSVLIKTLSESARYPVDPAPV